MTILQIITIYGMCLVVTLYMALSAGLRQRGNRSSPDFILLSCFLTWWLVSDGLYFIIPDLPAALFVHELKFLGVAFVPVFLFRFCMKFLHLGKWQSGNLLIVLCVIPLLTALMAMTNPVHNLFRTRIEIADTVRRVLYIENGPWFFLHMIYSYALLVICSVSVAIHIRKTSALFRAPQYVVLIGIGISLISNMVVILSSAQTLIDTTPVSMSAMLLFLYWAMGNSRMADYLNVAREEIYSTMATGVFILDTERTLVDMNNTARNWCEAFDIISPIGAPFDEVIERALLYANGEYIEGRWDNERDIMVDDGTKRRIYSLAETTLTDKSGRKIGSYVSMNDDTQARMLIERLERSAGVDPLTGLPNRLAYKKRLEEECVGGQLPFSVIMGDVNNLKYVNDRYGHEEGDRLLVSIADILKACVSEGGFVARIGGDEFVMLLPGVDENGARQVIDSVRKKAKLRSDIRTTPSIAMGCATKYYAGEDLTALIAEADASMYADKRNDRRQRGDAGRESASVR